MSVVTTVEQTEAALADAKSDQKLIRRQVKALSMLDNPKYDFQWVKDTLLGSNISQMERIDMFAKLDDSELATKAMELAESKLNDEQKVAMRLTRDMPNGVGMVQGPGGTGKTFLIGTIIQPLLFAAKEKEPGPIALILLTNDSVDHIVAQCVASSKTFAEELGVDRTITVMRLHARESEKAILRQPAMAKRAPRRPPFLSNVMNKELQDFAAAKAWAEAYAGTVPSPHADKRVKDQEHSHGQLMWEISGFVETPRSKKYPEEQFVEFRNCRVVSLEDEVILELAVEKFTAAQKKLADAALLEDDVIVTTVAGASDNVLYEVIKPFLILADEVARATDSDLWPVFVHYPKGPKLMVGDSRQLRPVSHYDNTYREQRRLGLMTRYMLLGFPNASLNQQHRAVKVLPISPRIWRARSASRPPRVRPLTKPFVDTVRKSYNHTNNRFALQLDPQNVQEGVLASSGSVCNMVNVRVVMDIVAKLIAAGIDPAKITILTPYVAQLIAYARARTLTAEQVDKRIGNIGLETVESVQGREFPHVIVDFVRTSSIGFLRERNRVKVALSRAKYGMLVVLNTAHASFVLAQRPNMLVMGTEN